MNNIENPRSEGTPTSTKLLTVVLLVVVGLWVLTPIVLSVMFTTWTERAAVGDAFGVINALFSGLAFGGVIIALWFQREQMRSQGSQFELSLSALTEQIREMRKAREMQSQPLITVSLPEYLMFQRPRIAPPGTGSGAISTFAVLVKCYNASTDPALNVKLKAGLQGINSAAEETVQMLSLPVMPKDSAEKEIAFTVTHESIFNSYEAMIRFGQNPTLISGNETACLKLTFWTYFENTTGAYFLSRQTFALIVKEADDAVALRRWIREWETPNESPEQESVHSIRLAGYSVPGTFSFSSITKEAFTEAV